MRFGLITPIVTLVPGRHGAWESDDDAEMLRDVVVAADQLGYAHLTCSDHVAIPQAIAASRGARYFDPFTTLGYFAAITNRVQLVTHVLVLPYHHPLEVAKRLGTLDRLSHGRVVAGVGVGSLREEFDLLGIDFDDRGERYEDALRALRVALDSAQPSYAGTHYRFDQFIVDPHAGSRVPIWIGGRTPRSLRRALRLADGWDPFGFTHSQLSDLLAKAADWPEWQQRDRTLELILALEKPLDLGPSHAAGIVNDTIAAYAALGATALNLQFRSRSLNEWIDQATNFMAKVAPAWDG
jgi:probable F420-dependent oxidoreductase